MIFKKGKLVQIFLSLLVISVISYSTYQKHKMRDYRRDGSLPASSTRSGYGFRIWFSTFILFYVSNRF